jgi:hypothetical protein
MEITLLSSSSEDVGVGINDCDLNVIKTVCLNRQIPSEAKNIEKPVL